ncbi:putative polysaccharide biosynthesis protein [Faecalimonas sp.]
METKGKKNEGAFLVQGMILAFAGIITKIIGVIYRIPLINIMGDQGQAYYGIAFEIYSLALLLTSYSLPLAVSKLVSARVSKGERRNAFKVFKSALVFGLVSGSVVGLIVFFGADFIATKIMAMGPSQYALRVLAPCLLVVAIMGVVRGYFQGLGTMIPTAVSQILEQIVNAIVSVVGASYLFEFGRKAVEAKGSENLGPAYSAAGGTLGTFIGAVFGLLFLLFVLFVYRKVIKKQLRRDHTTYQEEYGTIFPILLMTILPVILSTAVYQSTKILDAGIFSNVMSAQGMAKEKYETLWGMYTGKFNTLVNVPLAIANAIGVSVIPSLTAAMTLGDKRLVHSKIHLATRFSMLISIPSTIGYMVLAKPIMNLLFNGNNSTPALLLITGAITIAFYSLSTITNAMLQGIDRMTTPIKNATISLVIHLISLFIMLVVFKMNIFAVIGSTIVFSLSMCILNGHALKKAIGYHQEYYKTFILPLIASIIMGVVAFIIQVGLTNIIPEKIATIISVCVAIIVYSLALLLLGGLTENEILSMPKGRKIAQFLKKFHLLREEEV